MNTMVRNQAFPSLLNDLVNFSFDKVFNEDSLHTTVSYKAPANISETENAYVLDMAAPGRNKADFSIKVEKNILVIETVAKDVAETTKDAQTEESQKFVKKEFSLENIKRSFKLNEKIDVNNISAVYENGILSISLAKKEVVKETPLAITIA